MYMYALAFTQGNCRASVAKLSRFLGWKAGSQSALVGMHTSIKLPLRSSRGNALVRPTCLCSSAGPNWTLAERPCVFSSLNVTVAMLQSHFVRATKKHHMHNKSFPAWYKWMPRNTH